MFRLVQPEHRCRDSLNGQGIPLQVRGEENSRKWCPLAIFMFYKGQQRLSNLGDDKQQQRTTDLEHVCGSRSLAIWSDGIA